MWEGVGTWITVFVPVSVGPVIVFGYLFCLLYRLRSGILQRTASIIKHYTCRSASAALAVRTGSKSAVTNEYHFHVGPEENRAAK